MYPPSPLKGSRDLTVSLCGLERNLLLALLLARPQAVSFPVILSIRATCIHRVNSDTFLKIAHIFGAELDSIQDDVCPNSLTLERSESIIPPLDKVVSLPFYSHAKYTIP